MRTVTFTYPIVPKTIGGFEIDAFVVEQYAFGNKMTNIPVGEGVSISDHVSEEPDTVTVEAFIGNAVFETNADPIPDNLSDVDVPDPKTRIRLAYHELLRLTRSRQPVDLVTGLDTFADMVIVNFSIDRDAATGANLPFSMKLQRARTVNAEETEINASTDQAGRTADMGPTRRQETREPWAAREAYDSWRTRGSPTSAEFTEMFGMTPQEFAARFGG